MINRREFLRYSSVSAGVLMVSGLRGIAADGAVRSARPPNIVLILADDLGAECLGCYGGKSYHTPRLDQLAAGGMRFDYCYASPLCSPSRSELLTGRYCFRTGITNTTHRGRSHADRLDLSKHRTVANFLRDAGYATCIAGKWHLCNDFADNPAHVADAGFDDRFLWRLLRNNKVVRHYWNPELWVNDKPDLKTGRRKFGDDLFAAHVCEFVKANRDRPFFVYYPMTLVHSQTATGHNFPASPDTLQPGADPDKGVEPKNKGFGDLVSYMDKLVGRIADTIDKLGLSENTLLLFVGDNGTDGVITSMLGDRSLPGGKTRLDEAGTRVPLIARWKGYVPAGSVADSLVDLTDFLPTILAIAGVKLPPGYGIDGLSFLPQLQGQDAGSRQWVYRHCDESWYIRDRQYRLHSNGQLWDVSADAYAPIPAGDSPPDVEAKKRLSELVKELHARQV